MLRTVSHPPRLCAANLTLLADTLSKEGPPPPHWSAQQRYIIRKTIDLLITCNPQCPRWASLRVDQLTLSLEGCG